MRRLLAKKKSGTSRPWRGLDQARLRIDLLEDRTLLSSGGHIAALTGTIAPHTVTIPLLSTVPQLTDAQAFRAHAHATGGDSLHEVSRPAPNSTVPVSSTAPTTLAPRSESQPNNSSSDFVFFRDTALPSSSTAGTTSEIGEPAVGTTGRAVFETGNWYASVSGDNGGSFGYIDPYTEFPATGDYSGGFASDQRVAQDPSHSMIIWYLQYSPSGTTANDVGPVRIAVAAGQNTLLNNSWTYYNFSADSFGLGRGKLMDFPHIEVSSNYLYATSNVFGITDGVFYGAVLWRIPLSQLAAGGTINYSYWRTIDLIDPNAFLDDSLCLVSNSTSTMYAASEIGPNDVEMFQQSESDGILYYYHVGGLATTYSGTHTSLDPHGYNWTMRDDNRIQTGWVSGDTVGFMWDSAQSGDSTRPQPFVRALRVSTSDLTSVIDQPDLWSTSFAWAYPSLAVDARGHLAGPVFVGGPSFAPQVNVLVWDDLSNNPLTSGWTNYFAAGGTYGSPNGWGDFLSARVDARDANTWVGTGYVLNGAPESSAGYPNPNLQPYFFWFGRLRDDPGVIAPVADVGDTIYDAQSSGLDLAGGTYTAVNPIWSPTTGTADVDMYSFRGAAGAQVTLQTARPTGGDAMDTILRLFDVNGNPIAYNDDDPHGGTLYSGIYNFTLPYTGVYYVGVSGFANSTYDPFTSGSGVPGSVGDYQLSITLTPSLVPDIGDTLATAQDTGITTTSFNGGGFFRNIAVIGDGAYGAQDVDLYKFQAAAGSKVVARTTMPAGHPQSMDTILRLFDANGNQLAYNDDDPTGSNGLYSAFYNYALPYTGTYYVGVSGYSNFNYDPNTGGSGVAGSTGDYQLDVNVEAPLSPSAWLAVGPAPINGGQVPGGGPVSGRITAVAADPTNANTIYITAADGGVWKTTNGGSSWTPLTDNQATLAMGAIAIAPSNSSIIYAGTGEANNSGDSFYGRGVLKSTDGGTTWTLISGNAGVNEFDRKTISQILVDPTNANIVYVAIARGGANGVGGNDGIWKSTDGGVTWTNTTASISTTAFYTDVEIDPNNPQTLYAAVGSLFGNAANGVYVTTNGGASWALAGNFPSGSGDGLIKIAVARTNPTNQHVIYAAITKPGTGGDFSLLGIEKSTNGGTTWTALSGVPNYMGNQGWYDSTIIVDPTNANIVYVAGQDGTNSVLETRDGGMTWTDISIGATGDNGPHADHHGIAFDAAGHLLDGDDGGIWRLDNSLPGSIHWTDLNSNLQLTQFTGIALHPTESNIAYGGSQDNGTEKFSGSTGWNLVQYGDGGFVRVDPNHPDTVYHTFFYGNYFGFLERSDDGGQTWTGATSGINTTDPGNFYVPYVMDLSNSSRLILGTNRVYETLDRANDWTPISTPNTAGWNSTNAINALAIAPTASGTIYATAGGQIFVTTNDGGGWQEIDIPGFSDHFSALAVDPSNSAIAYIVRDRFTGGSGGHVFKTTNGGTNWTDITGNLPDLPTNAITLDPRTGVLYIGTDAGVYASANGGTSWIHFGTGLPNVRVVDLQLNTTTDILAVGTHGRGMWEIRVGVWLTFSNNTLNILGDANDTNLTIRLRSGDPTTTEIVQNGMVIGAFQSVKQINVTTFGGNDQLTVDTSNGNPVPSGGISYDGGTGTNSLVLDDSTDVTSQTILLAPGTISGLGAGSIIYTAADLASLTVNGGSGGNTFNVSGTSTGVTTTLNAGSGNDRVSVGVGTTPVLDAIQGALIINGQAGANSLVLNDTGNSAVQTYTISATGVSRAGVASISYSGLGTLHLMGSGAADSYIVSSVLATTPLTLVGKTGFANSLMGPASINTLTWHITSANGGNIAASANVAFSGMANLVGGSGPDKFAFAIGGSVTGSVNGGSGSNVLDYSAQTNAVSVTLQTAASSSASLIGAGFTNIGQVVGGHGHDTLTAANGTNSWNITGSNTGKLYSVITLNYASFEHLIGGSGADTFYMKTGGYASSIDGGTGSNALNFTNLAGPVTVNLQTATANGIGSFKNITSLAGTPATTDQLIGRNATTTWTISGGNSGTIGVSGSPTVTFSRFEGVTGGTGIDVFKFTTSLSRIGAIDGGAGLNWLDYSALTGGVMVNLASGTATDVAGTVANVHNIKGSQGADTLTGDASGGVLEGLGGNDTLTGGSGRSILVGGAGNDQVTGAGNDDIVIGGTTIYDSGYSAWQGLLAEWQRTDLTYLQRIADLRNGGGLNGSNKFIFGTTVLDDGNASTLTGNAGLDWFFQGVADTIADLQSGEKVNNQP